MPPTACGPRSSSATRSSTSPPPTPTLHAPWAELLERGPASWSASARSPTSGAHRIALDGVRLAPPVQPRKFFAIGLNYADHVAESGQPMPEHMTVFIKASSCVTGPV